MPYIKPEAREPLEPHLAGLAQAIHDGADLTKDEPKDDWLGLLNYACTRLALAVARDMGHGYATVAKVTGVLENVKQEFYRRLAAKYEDRKAQENGDIDGYA